MYRSIDQFRDYVLSEIDFYIEYFDKGSLFYQFLDEWNVLSSELRKKEDGRLKDAKKGLASAKNREAAKSELEKSEDKLSALPPNEHETISHLEIEIQAKKDELNDWIELEKNDLEVLSKLNELDIANNSGRLHFELPPGEKSWQDVVHDPLLHRLVELLKNSKPILIRDVEQFKGLSRNWTSQGTVDDFLLRLSLWSSRFTNDENGHLSMLGFYSILIGESMRHNEIGILDCLSQYLWKPAWKRKKWKQKLWIPDLIRAQMLIHVVYEDFNTWLSIGDISKSDINGMLSQWKMHLQIIEAGDLMINRLNQLNKVHNTTYTITELDEFKRSFTKSTKTIADVRYSFLSFKNEIENYNDSNNSKFPNELIALLDSILEENKVIVDIEQITSEFWARKVEIYNWADTQADPAQFKGWYHDFIQKIFDATFYKRDIDNPPLIQLVNTNTSAWASDREVVTMIVINKTKAADKNPKRRLEAYAAVPHEFGHDISDSFQNDCLIRSFKKVIRTNDEITHKDIWIAWINEIFADIVGVALLGQSSIYGLLSAIKDIGASTTEITTNVEKTGYDTHPVAIIRFKILIAFADRYFSKDDIEFVTTRLRKKVNQLFEDQFVAELEDRYKGGSVLVYELENDIKFILDIFLSMTHICLKSRPITAYFNYLRTMNSTFDGLTANFNMIENLPDEMISMVDDKEIKEIYKELLA